MMDLHARQSYQPNVKPKRWLWFIRLGKKIGDRYARLRQLGTCYFKQSKCDPYEFLPDYLELMERPPARSARVTAMAISLLVLLALTWAYLGELAIHATATGRLVLPSRAQTIQAYELGEVAAIFVQNGQSVKAGDQLLVLNTVGIREEMNRCQAQKSFQQLEVARYRALLTSALAIPDDAKPSTKTSTYFTSAWQEHLAMLDKFNAEIKMNQAEQRVHEKRLAGLQKLKKNIEKRLSPSRRLAQSNFMAKMTLLEREKEVLENQSSITAEQETLKVLQARAHTLQAAKSSYNKQKYREWHDQLHRTQSALSMAEQELAKAQARNRLQIVRAPMDGIVQQLAVHTIGGVVQAAQKLMILTPHDVPQQAEITIANKDIGFIQPGQPVTIKIEAFPYTRYGTINGTVQSISLDSIKPHESHPEFVFPAQIELAQNHMMIDDERVPLTPGMALVAEIKIGKQRIIDYLLSPIREYKSQAWREP